MTRKHKQGKRTVEFSMVTMLLIMGFVMVACSMAISIGVINPI